MEHHCQRAEDAENALTTFAALCQWSGDRGRVYPLDVRVKMLHLMGRHGEAKNLEQWGQLTIPAQRVSHPAERQLVEKARRAHYPPSDPNNRGHRA